MLQSLLQHHRQPDTPLHRLSPAIKLGTLLVLVGATAMLARNAWAAFAAIGVLLFAVALLGLIPPAYILRRLILMEPFVLGIALLSLLSPGGAAAFLGILAKSTLCLLAVILFAGATSFTDLLAVLRRARVPGIFVTTLALMYRYLFVLLDESSRMRRARQSRQFTRHRAHIWRSLATVAGQLFIRSSERAERIYAAMCARGWEPK